MFDYHLHSSISFDSQESAQDMIKAAAEKGLREICFTDHYDYNSDRNKEHNLFTITDYRTAYESIENYGITVKRGIEYGLTEWNAPELYSLALEYPFDFVIGSVHFVDGVDPYNKQYWEGITQQEGFTRYLEHTLECVKKHDGFDVLGHINYVCKSEHNPNHTPLSYRDYAEISDEIMKELVKKGKGMEINTSGVDKAGTFLPSKEFLFRFKELGGEIVTVGSDAHDISRVGQYSDEALEILKDIFGYVCTFENRKPKFNKL